MNKELFRLVLGGVLVGVVVYLVTLFIPFYLENKEMVREIAIICFFWGGGALMFLSCSYLLGRWLDEEFRLFERFKKGAGKK